MTDLFSNQTEKAGTSNGKFLGYLANGETPAHLRKRWSAGEFPDLNTAWAKVWIKST